MVRNAARYLVLLLLLPLFTVVLFFVHLWLQQFVAEIGTLPTDQSLERFGLVVSAAIASLLAACVFAYPLARLYRRLSPVAGLLISCATVAYLWPGYFSSNSGRSIVILTYATELASLVMFVPIAAWLVNRKLQTSFGSRSI